MEYVIWSFEHGRWWAPFSRGYTDALAEAGRYSAADAGRIVLNSVLHDEVAVLEATAERYGPPLYHPYEGSEHARRGRSGLRVRKGGASLTEPPTEAGEGQ